MDAEGNAIEQAAAARRERLRALKMAKELSETPDEDAAKQNGKPEDSEEAEEDETPSMKFRNYLPRDKQLQEAKLGPASLPKFEDPVAPAPLQPENVEVHFDDIYPTHHSACTFMNTDKSDVKSIRLDISFKSSSHTGLLTSELVRELTQQFPASVPLALVLKKYLADRSLDHAYSGGPSSYCLVLLIIRFLQHEHHVGRSNKQNLGGLLMDFLYFFGYIFDPRQMRVSIQGSGVYMNRERGLSIDPIHIDDPLYQTNNVGRNCFRIHQCIKAFADAYSVLESELPKFPSKSVPSSTGKFSLLQKIIPSI